jgi:hypothetical protein
VAQPAVIWVAPAPKVHTHNFYATGLIQTGTAAPVNLSSNQPYGGAAATHSLWQAGLQVIDRLYGCMRTKLQTMQEKA